MRFALEQFGHVLAQRDGRGKPYVLVGGQAVYFWASRYAAEERGVEQWRPFTSKDIAFQGGRDDVLHIAKELEAGSLSARGWLGALERVFKLAESSHGKKAVRTLEVVWTKALPLAEIAASPHPAAKGFREKRLVQWQSKLVRPA